MNKLLIIAIFLSLAFLGQGGSESQRPTPSNGPTTGQQQKQATPNEQNPADIKQNGSDKSKTAALDEFAQSRKQKEPNGTTDQGNKSPSIYNGLNFFGIKFTDWLLAMRGSGLGLGNLTLISIGGSCIVSQQIGEGCALWLDKIMRGSNYQNKEAGSRDQPDDQTDQYQITKA